MTTKIMTKRATKKYKGRLLKEEELHVSSSVRTVVFHQSPVFEWKLLLKVC